MFCVSQAGTGNYNHDFCLPMASRGWSVFSLMHCSSSNLGDRFLDVTLGKNINATCDHHSCVAISDEHLYAIFIIGEVSCSKHSEAGKLAIATVYNLIQIILLLTYMTGSTILSHWLEGYYRGIGAGLGGPAYPVTAGPMF